jgi:hypothetical protein
MTWNFRSNEVAKSLNHKNQWNIFQTNEFSHDYYRKTIKPIATYFPWNFAFQKGKLKKFFHKITSTGKKGFLYWWIWNGIEGNIWKINKMGKFHHVKSFFI